ncbi:MAG: hypothetical protein PHU97_11095, partial [Bacteroidales bacterium]|nr:hypothetical protein [Bacteroidales bacterium]
MNDYLDSLELVLDSATFHAGNGEYRNFKKFEKFWAPRIDDNGRFGQYFESVEEFYNNSRSNYFYYNSDSWQEI